MTCGHGSGKKGPPVGTESISRGTTDKRQINRRAVYMSPDFKILCILDFSLVAISIYL